MKGRITTLLAVLVLVLAGCTAPAAPLPPIGPEPEFRGEITVRGCTPVRALLPAATLDSCGLRVGEAVNAGLVRVNPDSGQPELELAEAIESSDAQLFTVRLAKGRMFHNGTEVRARNFVAAWNWAAYGPNQMLGQTWFRFIEGAAAMNCPRSGPCGKDSRPTSMTGLTVVDDYTFTMRTTRPMTDLRTRLAHPVFSPLPDAFFAEDEGKDMFGKLPVGAGPFRITGNTESEITLEAAEEYAGPRRPNIAQVTFRKYDDPARERDVTTAYNEVVANSLDFTDVIPTDQFVDDVWKSDLPERHGVREIQSVETLAFVAGDRQLADPRLRQAISLAIDREALARQVFAGTREPALSWVSPAVPGYRANACGDLCSYNLVEARRLFQQAGGYSGEFWVTVNGDGGHKQWADAVCNQLKNTLGLDCRVKVLANQAAVVRALGGDQLTGLVRQGWTMESLSADAALSVYAGESRRNTVAYRNPGFDTALVEGRTAVTQSEANAAYRRAELLLRDDPPSVPLWYAPALHGWSDRVTDVKITPFGGLDLASIRLR
jgi:oligopeptide transport system substrate-binding protein